MKPNSKDPVPNSTKKIGSKCKIFKFHKVGVRNQIQQNAKKRRISTVEGQCRFKLTPQLHANNIYITGQNKKSPYTARKRQSTRFSHQPSNLVEDKETPRSKLCGIKAKTQIENSKRRRKKTLTKQSSSIVKMYFFLETM